MMAWDPRALPWDWEAPLPNGCAHGGLDAEMPGAAPPSHTQAFQSAASFLSMNRSSADYASDELLPNQCSMLHMLPSYRNKSSLGVISQQGVSPSDDVGDCNATQGRIFPRQEGKFREEEHLDCGFKACPLNGLYPNECNILAKHNELDRKAYKYRNMVNLGGLQEEAPSDAGRVFLKQEHTSREEHLDHGSKAGSGVSGESSICLQLGKRTYFEDTRRSGGRKAAPKSIPRNSVKKSRVAAAQIHICQVEGCKTDLTSAKEYHRRHKVCEMHSKSAVVTVAGQEQRFCQQCSRFHILLEFDECKRSCRRRLAGHNERRRKPQPDLLAWNREYPNFQGDEHLKCFITERQSFIPRQGLGSISSARETPVESRSMFVNRVPKMLHFENESVHDCDIRRQEAESNYFPLILSHQINDGSHVQCQKFGLPVRNGVDGHVPLPRARSASNPSSGNSVLLPSAGASLGCASPQSLTRVLYSGCALSLLPSERPCVHASVPASLNLPALSSTMPDEWMHKAPFAGQPVQEDQVIPINSHSQSVCIASASSGNGTNIHGKEHYARLFVQDLIYGRNGESHGSNESQFNTSEDVKVTSDVVHLPSLSESMQMHGLFGPFQLGDGYVAELEGLRPFEFPVFASHQML